MRRPVDVMQQRGESLRHCGSFVACFDSKNIHLPTWKSPRPIFLHPDPFVYLLLLGTGDLFVVACQLIISQKQAGPSWRGRLNIVPRVLLS